MQVNAIDKKFGYTTVNKQKNKLGGDSYAGNHVSRSHCYSHFNAHHFR